MKSFYPKKAPGPSGLQGSLLSLQEAVNSGHMNCSRAEKEGRLASGFYKTNTELVPEPDKDSPQNKSTIKALNILMQKP